MDYFFESYRSFQQFVNYFHHLHLSSHSLTFLSPELFQISTTWARIVNFVTLTFCTVLWFHIEMSSAGLFANYVYAILSLLLPLCVWMLLHFFCVTIASIFLWISKKPISKSEQKQRKKPHTHLHTHSVRKCEWMQEMWRKKRQGMHANKAIGRLKSVGT